VDDKAIQRSLWSINDERIKDILKIKKIKLFFRLPLEDILHWFPDLK